MRARGDLGAHRLLRACGGALVLAALPSACKEPPPPGPVLPTIVDIRLEGAVAVNGRPVPETERARVVLTEALTRTGTFAVRELPAGGAPGEAGAEAASEAQGGGERFRLQVAVLSVKEPGDSGESAAGAPARVKASGPAVVLEASLVPAAPRTEPWWPLIARAEASAGEEVPMPAIEALAERALQDAAAGLLRRYRLTSAPLEEVLAVLDDASAGADLKTWAMTHLGHRKAAAAVPRLATLLDEDDRETVLAALEALVGIGDEAAVQAIVGLVRVRDEEMTGRVVRAVSQIGGEEAEAFLFTLSTGHPSEAIREGAQRSLAELRERAGTITAAARQPAGGAPDGGR